MTIGQGIANGGSRYLDHKARAAELAERAREADQSAFVSLANAPRTSDRALQSATTLQESQRQFDLNRQDALDQRAWQKEMAERQMRQNEQMNERQMRQTEQMNADRRAAFQVEMDERQLRVDELRRMNRDVLVQRQNRDKMYQSTLFDMLETAIDPQLGRFTGAIYDQGVLSDFAKKLGIPSIQRASFGADGLFTLDFMAIDPATGKQVPVRNFVVPGQQQYLQDKLGMQNISPIAGASKNSWLGVNSKPVKFDKDRYAALQSRLDSLKYDLEYGPDGSVLNRTPRELNEEESALAKRIMSSMDTLLGIDATAQEPTERQTDGFDDATRLAAYQELERRRAARQQQAQSATEPPPAQATLGKYDTQLTPEEESQYQEWRKSLPQPLQSEGDYDLRGYWKDPETQKDNIADGQHFTDKYKKPNHKTFSVESKYAVGEDAKKAGRWDGETFIPAESSAKDSKGVKKVTSADIRKERRTKDLNEFLDKRWFHTKTTSSSLKSAIAPNPPRRWARV